MLRKLEIRENQFKVVLDAMDPLLKEIELEETA